MRNHDAQRPSIDIICALRLGSNLKIGDESSLRVYPKRLSSLYRMTGIGLATGRGKAHQKQGKAAGRVSVAGL